MFILVILSNKNRLFVKDVRYLNPLPYYLFTFRDRFWESYETEFGQFDIPLELGNFFLHSGRLQI